MKDKIIMVTGVNGFVGKHAARLLKQKGYSVLGVGRENSLDSDLSSTLTSYISCDLTDSKSVSGLPLKDLYGILNLAGIPTTRNNEEMDALILSINVGVHEELYKALAAIRSSARIVAVSTGFLYEQPKSSDELNEDSPLQRDEPETNAYIRSKLRVEQVAHLYQDKGLDIIIARPFNHTGPGQGPGLFVPDKAREIQAAITSGGSLDFGSALDFWRDFTDVRDVVRAYELLLITDSSKLTYKTYNIASGVSRFGQDIFVELARQLNFENYKATLDVAASSSPKIVGDFSRLHADIGWRPEIAFEITIKDFVSSIIMN